MGMYQLTLGGISTTHGFFFATANANSGRITPWVDHLGYQNCFISAAFVGLACAAVFLVMIHWGKTFRTHTREKYWDIVNENWKRGMGH